MILAVLGDIHGNLPALQVALRHVDDEGIHTVFVTGDLVVGKEWSAEVCDMLMQRSIHIVQGLYDRHAAQFHRKQKQMQRRLSPELYSEVAKAADQLDSRTIEYLAGLPKRMHAMIEEISICLCHGTPTSQTDQIDPKTGDSRLLREREFTNADLILCGASHQCFTRQVGTTLFVNPGSLGIANAKGLGTYALVNTEEEPWAVTFYEVPLAENPNGLSNAGW